MRTGSRLGQTALQSSTEVKGRLTEKDACAIRVRLLEHPRAAWRLAGERRGHVVRANPLVKSRSAFRFFFFFSSYETVFPSSEFPNTVSHSLSARKVPNKPRSGKYLNPPRTVDRSEDNTDCVIHRQLAGKPPEGKPKTLGAKVLCPPEPRARRVRPPARKNWKTVTFPQLVVRACIIFTITP